MGSSFHEAAGNVTGSCHLVRCAGRAILVDCMLFEGGREMIATAATLNLARVVILDAAQLHEEEARRNTRHGKEAEPLYDTIDAIHALDRFGAPRSMVPRSRWPRDSSPDSTMPATFSGPPASCSTGPRAERPAAWCSPAISVRASARS